MPQGPNKAQQAFGGGIWAKTRRERDAAIEESVTPKRASEPTYSKPIPRPTTTAAQKAKSDSQRDALIKKRDSEFRKGGVVKKGK